MLDSFRFHSPFWFALAPLVAFALWRAFYQRQRPAAIFSSLADLKSLPVTLAQRVRKVLPLLYGLGLLLLIGALARPQMGKSESRIHTEGIAIEMALDISGSMRALDFQLSGETVNRLQAVKHVVSEFIGGSGKNNLTGRKSDLIGIVAFGGYADSKCPVTLDHGAVLDIVNGLAVPEPIRDRRGRIINMKALQEELATAIGDGLALAVDRLKNVQAKSKVLILLTDGDNNAGVIDPIDAANIAKTLGIKIYTIGVGHNGKAPVPDTDEFGQQFLRWQYFQLDEELLRKIAEIGGGKYYNATNTEALREVYAEIDELEKTKVEETRYTEYTELYGWLALPGVVLLFLVNCLWNTRFRALP